MDIMAESDTVKLDGIIPDDSDKVIYMVHSGWSKKLNKGVTILFTFNRKSVYELDDSVQHQIHASKKSTFMYHENLVRRLNNGGIAHDSVRAKSAKRKIQKGPDIKKVSV